MRLRSISWWRQYREIGLPRCHHFDPDFRCDRLIWPWQDWICEIEDWPKHHSCYHRHVSNMLKWTLQDERANPLPSNPDYHWDGYDSCRFCERTTASGFTEALTV